MAGEHCESGFWVVSTETHDTPIRVEHFAAFEQARARWKALGAALHAEVFTADDGLVLLYRDMEETSMSEPRAPGLYQWSEARGYVPVAEGLGPA